MIAAALTACTTTIGGEGAPGGSRSSTASSGTRIDYVFIPQAYAGNWTSDAYSQVLAAYRRDLAIMAALGARSVKVAIAPPFNGVRFQQAGGSTQDPVVLEAARTSLVALIQEAASYGLTVIVDFLLNDLYLRGPNGWYPNNNPNWFSWAYEAHGGSPQLVTDMVAWERALVEAVQAAGVEGSVDFYNLFTEAPYGHLPGAWEQVTHDAVRALLASLPLAPGRRGADAFRVADTAALAADAAASGAPLGVTEVHAYPDLGLNSDVAAAVQTARAALPGARVLVGEAGASFCAAGEDEQRQLQTFRAIYESAASVGAESVIVWGLWDYDAQPSCGPGDANRYGLGRHPDAPRDVLGYVVERMSALAGGDFEQGTSAWSAGGAGAAVSQAGWGDAATGQRYLRLTAQGGTAWTCSPPFPLDGTRVALTAQVRASAPSVTASVHYRDGQGWSHATGRSSIDLGLALSGWSWRNVQSVLGGRTFDLPAGALEAVLCFSLQAGGTPTYLDVDAVSVRSIPAAASAPHTPPSAGDPAGTSPSAAAPPSITGAGFGCGDGQCLWISGQGFAAAATVDVRRDCGGNLADSYIAKEINHVSANQLTLRLHPETLALLSSAGAFHLWVVNSASSWSGCHRVGR
jgi:hypothetical protein